MHVGLSWLMTSKTPGQFNIIWDIRIFSIQSDIRSLRQTGLITSGGINGMTAFLKGSGDWTQYRTPHNIVEIDFHVYN